MNQDIAWTGETPPVKEKKVKPTKSDYKLLAKARLQQVSELQAKLNQHKSTLAAYDSYIRHLLNTYPVNWTTQEGRVTCYIMPDGFIFRQGEHLTWDPETGVFKTVKDNSAPPTSST